MIEYYDGDTKAEMFEVLRHAEEVCRKIVVKKEVVDFLLDLCGGGFSYVLDSGTIAHFGVELLTRGECFVRFNEFQDVIRHFVVMFPWHILHFVIDRNRGCVLGFLEDFGCLGGEGGEAV
jgi:hypothetical protein